MIPIVKKGLQNNLIWFLCLHIHGHPQSDLRDGPFDIQGGGAGIFLKNIVCFPTGAKKNKISSTKLKIKHLFFFE